MKDNSKSSKGMKRRFLLKKTVAALGLGAASVMARKGRSGGLTPKLFASEQTTMLRNGQPPGKLSRSPSWRLFWSSRGGCFSRSTPMPGLSVWASRSQKGEPSPVLSGQRDGALPHRKRSASRSPSLAGHLPPRLLSRRADLDQCPQRHRSGPLGHQGQSLGVPVYELLGGPTRSECGCMPTLGHRNR